MKKFIITTVILFMSSVIFAANLKLIYFHTQYNNVDITQLQHGNDLTAQYWILGRETEVDTVTTFVLNDTLGSLVASDLQYFTTDWAVGDTLHVEYSMYSKTGIGEWIINDTTSTPVYPPDTPLINIFPSYIISGIVRDSASTPIEGVLLTGTNTNPDTLTTGFDGSYQFNANEHSEVTIEPSKTGYDFDPLNFYNADITQDYENYNFTAVEWTPDPPTGGTPQGTNVPLTTSHITWSAPAGGCPVTKHIVTMSVDSIAVEGFDSVEVLAPDTTITIPADTLHYSTTYEVSIIANYTAPVRGNSIPLEWNFSTEDLPPVASFSSNLTDGYAPLSVDFIDQSTPGSGMILEWKWFFGDGDSSFVQNPTHVYQNLGTYTVSLTVTDEHDSTDTEVKIDYISVILQPAADFTADLFSGYVPLEVSFTDQSQGNIITWAWDFNGDEIVDSYLQSPVYTYFQEGIYPVSLTINDSISEDTEVKQDYIEVSNLVITEILQNPGAVLDIYGEWFEILNPCDFSIDLNGVIIKDNDLDSHLIDTTTVIQAGRYFVLGKNADYATNGGVNLDYEYSDITLSNHSDELIFVSPLGTTIDSVGWDNGVTFPDPDSASMALLAPDLDNSIGTNWTTSIIPYGDGDFGTPGYPNFAGQISVSTDSISFPDLMIGMNTDISIEIFNTGNGNLEIDSIYTNNGVFIPAFNDTIIQTGESVLLPISFIPAVVQNYSAELFIISDDYINNEIIINLFGNGIEPNPDIYVNPDTLDFGIVNIGELAHLDLVIYNLGIIDLIIPEVEFGLGASSPFYTFFEEALIVYEDSVIVTIYFYSQRDFYSDIFYIYTNYPDEPYVAVPIYANSMIIYINVPEDYSTIQEAINASMDGDDILVEPGTYYENINFNGKMITLNSYFVTTQDTSYISQTIIDGNGDASVVTFSSGEDSASVLSGFTIMNGSGTNGTGGGIICTSGSSPILQNLIIKENSASDGGGIFCLNNSNPTITNVKIQNNLAFYAGGIYCFSNSNPVLKNVIISDNNTFYEGAGILCDNSNPVLKNVIISGNNAATDGGGIYCYNNSNPVITNATICNNTSASGGGIGCTGGSHPVLTNCILWFNSPEDINLSRTSRDITITYSNISAGWAGTGNISVNPLFVDYLNEDFHLSDYSLCIGAGTINGAPSEDIEGNPRPAPGGSNPDMGAYENTLAIPIDGPIIVNYINPVPGPVIINEADSINFSIDAYDTNGNPLEYSWELDSFEVSYDSTYLFTTDYSSAGNYVVTLYVTDNFGLRTVNTRADTIFVWNITVNDVPLPGIPDNIIITITADSIMISWDVLPDVLYYKVYSSDNPYSDFTEDFTGVLDGASWTAPVSDNKKFYKITSVTE